MTFIINQVCVKKYTSFLNIHVCSSCRRTNLQKQSDQFCKISLFLNHQIWTDPYRQIKTSLSTVYCLCFIDAFCILFWSQPFYLIPAWSLDYVATLIYKVILKHTRLKLYRHDTIFNFSMSTSCNTYLKLYFLILIIFPKRGTHIQREKFICLQSAWAHLTEPFCSKSWFCAAVQLSLIACPVCTDAISTLFSKGSSKLIIDTGNLMPWAADIQYNLKDGDGN